MDVVIVKLVWGNLELDARDPPVAVTNTPVFAGKFQPDTVTWEHRRKIEEISGPCFTRGNMQQRCDLRARGACGAH